MLETIISPQTLDTVQIAGWVLIGLVMLFLEAQYTGFIFMSFGLGSWLTALTRYMTYLSFEVQLTLFLFSSMIIMISVKDAKTET
jgi:membrane protein implicated in regulation of membrane protease activity